MSLRPGTRLGHYDVTSLLGEGGMGQVWQATDTQLNRQVALKILPDAFADDPDRLARFTREAQILASLNHPGIAAIYGIEEDEVEGRRALVLELVEGPTLADRIAKGPIPLDEALPIAKQIAEALEAAHEAGVIHRDLKPANIKVRDDGTVKVLDFGLAKALDAAPHGDPSQSPTLTAAATQMGVILGTAAYMSPEQARGKPVDKRTDIWAFSCVLYEMLAGRAVFGGDTLSDTIASIIEGDPEWEALPAATPSAVRTLLRRCLAKDPRARIPDIGVARIEIDEIDDSETRGADPSLPAARVSFGRALTYVSVPAVAALFGGLVVWGLFVQGRTVPRLPATFDIAPPPIRLSVVDSTSDLAISPGGALVVYRALSDGRNPLMVRALAQLEATPLVPRGWGPFFSPDGQSVGYFEDEHLWRVPAQGGLPTQIAAVSGISRGASWGADGTIIFATTDLDSGLWRVDADGGQPVRLTTPALDQGERDHVWPQFLPDAHGVLFTITGETPPDGQIAVLSLGDDDYTPVLQGGSGGRFASTGHLVYRAGGTLQAVQLDLERRETIGDPVQVVDDAARFDMAANGTLIHRTGQERLDRAFVWVDRAGDETALMAGEPIARSPRLSPDGGHVAWVRQDDAGVHIWTYDIGRQTSERLTTAGGTNSSPLWTPDGESVTFISSRDWVFGDGRRRTGVMSLWSRRADRSAPPIRLATGERHHYPVAWTEGATLIYLTEGNVMTLSDGVSLPWLESDFAVRGARLSDDGRWLAYVSDELGESRVVVRAFPEGGAAYSISAGPAEEPVWSRDGTELFYRDGSHMMAVAVSTDPDFDFSVPRRLFPDVYLTGHAPDRRHYPRSLQRHRQDRRRRNPNSERESALRALTSRRTASTS